MSLFLQLLILVGAIALFLYGMKTMGEALQKISGQQMRHLLRTMTNSPLKQVSVGMLATSIIQSSSATTVMIISFVNAGLLSLLQSLGMIMGANIGTTTTAWIIALFGFNLDISVIAIPLVGLGFPLLINKSSKARAWGNMIIGFALVFVAIDFMTHSVDVLSQYELIGGVLNVINDIGIIAILSYFALGMALTMLVRSSSTVITLTIVLCHQGITPCFLGAAMVLGSNLGSAIITSRMVLATNINARRAALFHLTFNCCGAVIGLLFLTPLNRLVGEIMTSAGAVSPLEKNQYAPVAIAIFHTVFNVGTTLLFVGFVRPIASLLSKIIKDKGNDKYKLQYMDSGIYATGAISLVQAQQALINYASKTALRFEKVTQLFNEHKTDRFYTLFEQIEKQSNRIDAGEQEFNTFLSNALKGDIGNEAKEHIRRLTKLASDVVIMSEAIYNVAKVVKHRKDKGAWFTPELRQNVNQMFELVDQALEIMNSNLSAMLSHQKPNIEQALEIEVSINRKRIELRKAPIEDEDGYEININSWTIFTDIISKSDQLADSILRISKDVNQAVNLNTSDLKDNERKTL